MTKLIAYFDESGTDGRSPIVAVAGYISTVELWAEFQRKWNFFKKAYNFDILHITDLLALRKDFAPENGWTKGRARLALREADRIISGSVLKGFAAYTTVTDAEKMFPSNDPNGKRKRFSTEYLTSAVMVANLITAWAETNGYIKPIEFVFENGANGKGYLMQATDFAKKSGDARTHLIGDISFRDKKDVPQLQTADRLVYLACKSINNFLIDENSADKDMAYLRDQLRLDKVHVLDNANFPLLAKELNLDINEI